MNLKEEQKKEVTIGILEANLWAIVLFVPFLFGFGGAYILVWYQEIMEGAIKSFFGFHPLLIALVPVVILMGIVAHELIHGLVWGLGCKNGFRSIKFGVMWKMITPYCHCKEPLKVNRYRWGAVMPGIVLGFLPSLYAIFSGDFGALLFGLFFTMAAGGDFLMIVLLRKVKGQTMVQDHPTKLGCYLIEPSE